jgi:hypothetical protein
VAKKGCIFSERQVKRIVQLLGCTDMTLKEIAERMECSKSGVIAINRKFRVRNYAGWRNHWTVPPEKDPEGTLSFHDVALKT